jgi:hypothetical protein
VAVRATSAVGKGLLSEPITTALSVTTTFF